MLTRDQGQRRIQAVTIGLAAASVVGTLAVGVAAYAKESDTPPKTNPTPGPGAPSGTPAPGATTAKPPPAAPAKPQAPATTPQLRPPPGDIVEDEGPGHATSGGT